MANRLSGLLEPEPVQRNRLAGLLVDKPEYDPIEEGRKIDQARNYSEKHPELSLLESYQNIDDIIADPDDISLVPRIQSKSLVERFGKQIANSFAKIGQVIISSPLSPIGIPKKEAQPYYQQAVKEIEASGFKGSAAQTAQLAETRAAQLAAAKKVPSFKVEPAATKGEKAVDIGAGLTAFIAQLAIARKILPNGTPEAVVWEVQNQLTDGVPGEGAAMALTLGFIGKIPAKTIAGRSGKMVAESAVFAGLTAARGGTVEDILISAAIPPALKATRGFRKMLLGAKVYDYYIDQNVSAKQHRVKARQAARQEINAALKGREANPAEWERVMKKYSGWATVGEAVKTPDKTAAQLKDFGKYPLAQAIDRPGQPLFVHPTITAPDVTVKAPVAPVAGRKAEIKPVEPSKPAEAKPAQVSEKKVKARPGFVDLTPLAEAGPQVRAIGKKAEKFVTRFTGLEPEVRKVLIEYEEQLRELPKVAAKDAIEKFGKLTPQEERAIENHRENPKKYPDLPEKLQGHLDILTRGIEEYGARLEELGYPADWPNTYVERLTKLLQKEESRKEPNPVTIAELEQAIEEGKDLQYLHHQYQKTTVGKRVLGRFKRGITKKPTGVLGRKIPTYEKAEELGLKRAPLAVSYAHMRHEIERAEMANDLIVAINENPNLSLPEKEAPDEWVKLDERIFPASVQRQTWIEEGKPRHKRTFRKYPLPIAEALQELTYSRGNEAIERAYDKLNFALKIIGFYNPVVMTKNDAVQLWRAAGIHGAVPLLLPEIGLRPLSIKPPKAVQIWMEKGPTYEKLRKGGLFNNVVNYTPAVTEITQQMLNEIRETSGEKAARIAGEILNPANLIKNIRKYNDLSTWNMDEIMRIAAWEAVKDTRMLEGMTDFEKIEWVNDGLVNYGKFPKSTKRWVGKAMFVPTYRVGNFRYFWSEVSKVYHGQGKHMAPILRTVAYKMFVRWGLPAIVGAAILYRTDEERDVRTEKGYRLVIHNPKTNTDTVYALSDPLLEGAKLTQRTLRHTFALNLAPLPSLIIRASGGPRFKQSDDQFGEFFKLGTPVYRDILNWKDPDKTVAQKILTQLAIAFVYTRRGREADKERIITALAKALSIWTDWKEQASDLKKMVSGKSYYLGPGGKFGRLMREFRMEQDIDRTEVDKDIDALIAKGDYDGVIRKVIETERYATPEGIANRILNWRAPLVSYWLSMSSKERAQFIAWLEETKQYSQKELGNLQQALLESMPEE